MFFWFLTSPDCGTFFFAVSRRFLLRTGLQLSSTGLCSREVFTNDSVELRHLNYPLLLNIGDCVLGCHPWGPARSNIG
ncbi:hypothetical protein K1719_027466 [Acacia pycnantha]|nr:hypothetical protein K1719_027466 [Acacia pycnantha]